MRANLMRIEWQFIVIALKSVSVEFVHGPPHPIKPNPDMTPATISQLATFCFLISTLPQTTPHSITHFSNAVSSPSHSPINTKPPLRLPNLAIRSTPQPPTPRISLLRQDRAHLLAHLVYFPIHHNRRPPPQHSCLCLEAHSSHFQIDGDFFTSRARNRKF